MKNPRAGLDVRGSLKILLESDRLEQALRLIENTVDTVFAEPLNTARIFGDRFLDDACQEIGRMHLARIRSAGVDRAFPAAARDSPKTINRMVFVASRLQASGGHTAVLADIARRADTPVTVLITGVGGPTDRKGIAHLFSGIADLKFEFAPRGSRLRKLDWL